MRPATRTMMAKAMTWSAQIWLSMAFFGAGYAKLTVPHEHLVLMLGWPAGVPMDTIRGIGAGETILGLALIINLIVAPSARQPVITAAVAVGLIATTMGAYHLIAREFGLTAINAGLLVLAGIVLRGYCSQWARRSEIADASPPRSRRHRRQKRGRSLRRGLRPLQRHKTDRDDKAI